MHLETKRQAVHGISGVLFAIAILLLPLELGFVLLAVSTILLFFFRKQLENGRDMFLVSKLVKHTERKGKRIASGVPWYFAGVLTVFVVFGLIAAVPKEIVVASMLIVAVGDSLCTGLGRKIGKKKLPRTTTKSYRGSLIGFFFAFLVAAFVLQPLGNETAIIVGFAGAFVGMLAEAYVKLDDNFTIPVLSASAMVIAYAIVLIG
jgi:dolichol kinase